MIAAWALGVALAGEAVPLLLLPEGSPHATLGTRLDPDGPGRSVAIGEEWVVGGDGATAVTRISARYGASTWSVAAHLPFATYAVPGAGDADVQRTGLGNLRIDAFFRRQAVHDARLVGVQIHLPVGRAYTWTHAASGVWPGGGATAVFQQRGSFRSVDLLVRTAVGLHATGGFAPFPAMYVHAGIAGGAEVELPAGLSLLGEVSLAYWEPSPLDVSGWVSGEPAWADGLRVRGGLVAPVGTWMGLSPSGRPAGVRELTLLGDVAVTF